MNFYDESVKVWDMVFNKLSELGDVNPLDRMEGYIKMREVFEKIIKNAYFRRCLRSW